MENTNFVWLLQNQERFNPARGVSFGGLFGIFQDLPKPLFHFLEPPRSTEKIRGGLRSVFNDQSPGSQADSVARAFQVDLCGASLLWTVPYRTVPYRTDEDHKINQSQRRFLIEGDKKGLPFSAELSFPIQ